MEKLQPIILGEGKYDNNLKTLIRFYNEVWGVYKKYVKNDSDLYKMFKDGNNERFATLNIRYSTRISATHINSIQGIIQNSSEYDFELLLQQIQTQTGKAYKSYLSKYLHWHNEVKNIENATPIYDKHIRYAMIFYQMTYTYTEDFNTLKGYIDNFITKYLGENCQKTHEVKVGDWKHAISTYRLVDKFLWLSYKVIQDKDGEIKEAYEKLYNEVMNKK